MSIIGDVLGLIFGHDPIGTVAKSLSDAYVAQKNSQTEQERIRWQAEIDRLHALLGDLNSARSFASTMPPAMMRLAIMIAFPFALHVLMVGLGTCFRPWIVNGWFDGLLHVPPFPAPFDTQEANIIAYFFGATAVASLGSSAVNAVARAVSRK